MTNENSSFDSNATNIDEQQQKLSDNSLHNNCSNILSISFFTRIRTYEEETERKIKEIINDELDERNSSSSLKFENRNEC